MKPRVAFLGTPGFAAAILTVLVEAGWDIPLVITNPDRPRGRGRTLAASAVSEAARRHGLAIRKPGRDGLVGALSGLPIDAVVVASYGQLLAKAVLDLYPDRFVNVHASLLPAYRGASPIQAALLAGDSETGVSLMVMDEGLDTGPVFATEKVTIAETDTAGTLSEKLAVAGAAVLESALPKFIQGDVAASPQPEASGPVTRKLTKDDGKIDWSEPAGQIARQVRAYQPWPGAWTLAGGTRLEIVEAAVDSGSGVPGTLQDDLIATGSGGLRLRQVRPAGKSTMPAADWLRGYRGPTILGT